MANTSDIRKGLCINFNNDLYQIIDFQHVKPGKGNAFVRTKLKSITSGKIIDHTFQAGHSIDPVRVERRTFQYLYSDEFAFHFMNDETYEQVAVNKEMVDHAEYMKESEKVEILFHAAEERPLVVELPQYVELQVTYTEPGVRGDTATNAQKPATVETGAEIRVPLFINQSDVVKIETETGNYIERVKQ